MSPPDATDHALHVVCPACATVNRLPESRLGNAPTCGNCKQPLFTGQPVALTRDTFDAHVARSDIPVVVDFWAEWCGPCRSMAPHFARVGAALEPRLRFAKVDTEAQPEIAARYAIRGIPTLIVYLHGREIARRTGALETRALLDWLGPIASTPRTAADAA